MSASPIRPLRTDDDYAAALEEVRLLRGAEENSASADRLAVLAVLIADYERRCFPLGDAQPMDVVLLDMRLHGRTQADLAHVLGSRSRASELLASRRALSPAMADRLAKAWGLPRDLLGPQQVKARRRLGAKMAKSVAGLVLGVMLLGGGGYAWVTHDLPSIAPLVAAARDPAMAEAAPLHVRQAFLAAEDSAFYQHGGGDSSALVRAGATSFINLARGRRPNGGATITEQLVKGNLQMDEPRSLRRRLRTMMLAARVEASLSKDDILALYLGTLYLGGEVRGLDAASRHYFGVAPSALSVSQAAMLAALPAAPNAMRIDVAENLPRARQRRTWVLGRMAEEGYITRVALNAANAEPLPSSSGQP